MPPLELTETQSKPHTLVDISVPIRPTMPVFPGDPGVEFEQAMDMAHDACANVTRIHIGSQTGTHFDTPHHILNNGQTVETLPLEVCYGPARVIDIPESIQAIGEDILKTHDLQGCERLLLKTRNSEFWYQSPEKFREDFAALAPDGAEYLAQLGVRLVGIDYLSIELFGSKDLLAHKALLNRNILILEGINLHGVEAGWYMLCAFPVLYDGLDGAPTRAVLIKN